MISPIYCRLTGKKRKNASNHLQLLLGIFMLCIRLCCQIHQAKDWNFTERGNMGSILKMEEILLVTWVSVNLIVYVSHMGILVAVITKSQF